MSWKWIPAQLDQYLGSEIDINSNSPNQQFQDQLWVPGYYLGEKYTKDYPFVLTHLNPSQYNPLSSTNGWVVSRYPYWCYQYMLYDENGNELLNEPSLLTPINGVDPFDEGIQGNNGSPQFNSYQNLYGGKPVWWGSYELNYFTRSIAMFYSTTEQKFIIFSYSDLGSGYNILHEPVYAPNTLSGGNTGEYFWKSGAEFLDPTQGPWDFNLAGGVDSYEGIDGTKVAKITVSLKADQFYTYSSPASVQSQETPPAGEYTNPVTGDKKLVGLASFVGNDGSIWTMHNYGLTSEYWVSEQHGGINNALWHPRNANYWVSDNDWRPSHPPYFICNVGLSSLYGQTNLLLENQEYDSQTSSYNHVVSGDVTLNPGPMQLVKEEDTILMGELAIWR